MARTRRSLSNIELNTSLASVHLFATRNSSAKKKAFLCSYLLVARDRDETRRPGEERVSRASEQASRFFHPGGDYAPASSFLAAHFLLPCSLFFPSRRLLLDCPKVVSSPVGLSDGRTRTVHPSPDFFLTSLVERGSCQKIHC